MTYISLTGSHKVYQRFNRELIYYSEHYEVYDNYKQVINLSKLASENDGAIRFGLIHDLIVLNNLLKDRMTLDKIYNGYLTDIIANDK